ncbi:MAG: hypothetical protein ACRD5L_17365 [Bryobacteraceae bacterium]
MRSRIISIVCVATIIVAANPGSAGAMGIAALWPPTGAKDVCPDTLLRITFD